MLIFEGLKVNFKFLFNTVIFFTSEIHDREMMIVEENCDNEQVVYDNSEHHTDIHEQEENDDDSEPEEDDFSDEDGEEDDEDELEDDLGEDEYFDSDEDEPEDEYYDSDEDDNELEDDLSEEENVSGEEYYVNEPEDDFNREEEYDSEEYEDNEEIYSELEIFFIGQDEDDNELEDRNPSDGRTFVRRDIRGRDRYGNNEGLENGENIIAEDNENIHGEEAGIKRIINSDWTRKATVLGSAERLTNRQLNKQLRVLQDCIKSHETGREITSGDIPCAICLSNAATRLAMPCGHRYTCGPCGFGLLCNVEHYDDGERKPFTCGICRSLLGALVQFF